MVNVPATQAAFCNLAGIAVNCQLNPSSLDDVKDFCTHFGVAPVTCIALWIRIQGALPRGTTPFHLLLVLLCLKTCEMQFDTQGNGESQVKKDLSQLGEDFDGRSCQFGFLGAALLEDL